MFRPCRVSGQEKSEVQAASFLGLGIEDLAVWGLLQEEASESPTCVPEDPELGSGCSLEWKMCEGCLLSGEGYIGFSRLLPWGVPAFGSCAMSGAAAGKREGLLTGPTPKGLSYQQSGPGCVGCWLPCPHPPTPHRHGPWLRYICLG